MPIGIIIAAAVVLILATAAISHFATVSSLKKNAESKICLLYTSPSPRDA